MKVKVTVTQDDINFGEPGCDCTCPIALAAQRALPSIPCIYVGIYTLFSHAAMDHSGVLCPLPQSAMDFIGRFDNALTVEPFEFDVDVPEVTA